MGVNLFSMIRSALIALPLGFILRFWSRLKMAVVVSSVLFAFPGAMTAAPVDPSFTTDSIDSGNGKTKIESDSAGRLFVTEKQGRILLYRPNGSGSYITPPSVLLDLRSSIDATTESGLLGLALDPDFDTNRYLYLFYTTTTDQRLVRYTADASLSGVSSPLVMLSGLPRVASFHKGGDIGFHPLDPDHLFISLGDDNNVNRPRDLDFYEGKILRVSKSNGQGVDSNPFYNGDPTSVCSRVWAIGFRNPFRFTFHPARADVLYVSENGDATDRLAWVQRGSDGNWGPAGDTAFLNPTDPNFRILFSGVPSHVGVVIANSGVFAYNGEPTIYLSRWHPNAAILRFTLSGADLDTATPIPDGDGTYFWENGALAVDFELHADGHLYFTTTNGNSSEGSWYSFRRYRKTDAVPPVASFSAVPANLSIGEPVAFVSTATAGGAAISGHHWQFGDGNESTEISPGHTYLNPGIYQVTLTVTDLGNLSHAASSSITVTQTIDLDLNLTVIDSDTGTAPMASIMVNLLQSNGDFLGAISINSSGQLVFDDVYDLTGDSVILEITAPGYQTLVKEFDLFTINETFFLSGTAISGRVTTADGEPAFVDLGVYTMAGDFVDIPGGRDYQAPFIASGINHRVETDNFGRFYIPVPDSSVSYQLIPSVEVNRYQYASPEVEVVVNAGENSGLTIVVGEWDGGEGRDDLSAIPVTPSVSYATIQTIFSSNCTGCHRANTENSGGLDLTNGNSLAALFGQPSNFVPGLTLVEPGSPSRSYLFEKVNRAQPQQGARMRPSDSMSLTDQALIRDWIAQLAPTYESFLLTNYSAIPGDAGTEPGEDFNQDGIDNQFAYLNNSLSAPVQTAGPQMTLSLAYANDPIDLTFIMHESSDLVTWEPIAIKVRNTALWHTDDQFSISESIANTFIFQDLNILDKKFYRLSYEFDEMILQ